MIMRHRSQGTTAIFVKKSIEDDIPTTIEFLRKELSEFPDTKLAERLMCFGSRLRGTKEYWNTCHSEFTDMISQIGFPTLFSL